MLMGVPCSQEMMHMTMQVVVKNEVAKAFALRGLSGWAVDDLSSVVHPNVLEYA